MADRTTGDPADAEPSFWPTPATTAALPGAARPQPSTSRPSSSRLPAVGTARLPDLCEPLFQYVCRLNRLAKTRSQDRPTTAQQVRVDLKGLLADARDRAATGGAAAGGPSLPEQWQRVEPAMIFFADFMVRASPLPFAARWDDLAKELLRELTGDERFFDLLEEALADKSPAGADRVAVFYTCLGLGFTGIYTGQPEYLRRKMLDCSSHIRSQIDADGAAKVCPDAYQHNIEINLVESPARSVVGVAIALVGLTIALFVANGYCYHNSMQRLDKDVSHLAEPAGPPGQSAENK
jgi:type VI protein secretion system component VasF